MAMNEDLFSEIMLNPDGAVWAKHNLKGNTYIGRMDEDEGAAFVHALAQYEGKFLNCKTPYLDVTLPFHGERINVTIPPITDRISFNIRKKAKKIYSLDDYVNAKILTEKQKDFLTQCIANRKNILVSGSPASGKTTLANALLDTMAQVVDEGHRILILEQVQELQCPVKNLKTMVVTDNVSMNSLLWLSMRNSPDRIVIGEVRDGAALDMLKAWNTGCPGGIATIHANNPVAAVQRVLDLACEVVTSPPYVLAAEALDIILQIEECTSHPARRLVTGIMAVTGFDTKTQSFKFEHIN